MLRVGAITQSYFSSSAYTIEGRGSFVIRPNTIPTIKAIRQVTDMGLLAAKTIWDAFQAAHGGPERGACVQVITFDTETRIVTLNGYTVWDSINRIRFEAQYIDTGV